MKEKENVEVILWVKINYDRRNIPGIRRILRAQISFLRAYKKRYPFEYKKCNLLATKKILKGGD